MVCHFRENDKPLYKKRFVTSSRMTKRFFLNVRPFKMEWAHIFCFSIFILDDVSYLCKYIKRMKKR